mmetsp:Transcript_13871/g.19862  ORF Transcript_13871/g.19862 Transcript_13871/m.19862 type:complete len:873 (+) Transcript_13871:103-2721(+)|eukprot:CAMPEP_0184871516 /NCGR_PEP_ID=MMETSP0580-20130426/40764_1 /TAXON_ID=1118495 /ORGANISM="Dactyliosolen fragilissimus" /LENGTH=872 /DNA_ID=CAMNT_0027374183 /DNA_START=30 /DNA_END=2648 /DNA_ORIENTATION=-
MTDTDRKMSPKTSRRPVPLFDIFFDIPHPAASSLNAGSRVIDPPDNFNSNITSEMCKALNISRIARFAFPDHDDQTHASSKAKNNELLSASQTLNRYDMYLYSFTASHHTFSIQIDDGTRVHGHVRRYLPLRSDVKTRADVGRRGSRAMILLTRVTGGERFYATVLKMIEALVMKETCLPAYIHRDEMSLKPFLHALCNGHGKMLEDHYKAIQSPDLKFLKKNYNLQMIGIEFHCDNKKNKHEKLQVSSDNVVLNLPETLEPGYDFSGLYTHLEDLYSPMLPLLRNLGPSNTLRLLSAMLCELRIIMVSRNISKLSECVKGAAAMLAQGMLIWRHILIPVLPPHLMRYLTIQSPYIVGIVDQIAGNLANIPELSDVLTINLDTKVLSTINMVNPLITIPDLLDQRFELSPCYKLCEVLVKDLNGIEKSDQRVWEMHMDTLSKEERNTAGDAIVGDNASALNQNKQRTFKSALRNMIGLRGKNKAKNAKETNDNDAFALFGKIVRRDVNLPKDQNDETGKAQSYDKEVDTYEDIIATEGDAIEACAACENERGEELLRASLVCFFLELYGDMGMYLSQSQKDGKFWMDRYKFLLRKKTDGESESTPMFSVLGRLTRSLMFEQFVRSQIIDIEKPASERKYLMSRHIPLFVICSKHLTKKRLSFTTENIRNTVFVTIDAYPQHEVKKKREIIRERALVLTSEKPLNGEVNLLLQNLVEECRECNGALCQVFAVIWMRLSETRASLWKRPLLGLYLLKNLILHGPVSAIIEAMDGVNKISALRNYTVKNIEASESVRSTAKQVYDLLVDLCHTFWMRRRIMMWKAVKIVNPYNDLNWANFIIRRIPITTDFRHMHVLLRPNEFTSLSIERRSKAS